MSELEYRKGVILAICAYSLWGFAPLYFKLIQQVSPLEILMHRVLWSFVLMVVLIQFVGGFSRLRQVLKQPKQLLVLLITSLLIAGNWLIFIWAINNDHMLDASLGYFINPLFNVLLAMLFLGERLRKLQWVAVALASLGVIIQLISFGSIPLLSLVLAASFGFYGLLRKKVNVDAKTGLLVETAILAPVALGYLLVTLETSSVSMLTNDWGLNLILMAAGIVTTVPLLCFAGAAVRIPFSILGFFQYIGPSIMFMLAILLFNEPFDMEKATTFGFIWVALMVFVSDLLLQRRRNKKAKAASLA
jgi:chloramphenicol-sensitive protein RarD